MKTPNVIGLEFVVSGINEALAFCVDVLGFELVYRGPARGVAGTSAVLDAGSITITLLEPAHEGPGLIADRSPRLSQLVLGGPTDDLAEVREAVHDAGVPTKDYSDGRYFVAPEVTAGILGFETALMFTPIEE